MAESPLDQQRQRNGGSTDEELDEQRARNPGGSTDAEIQQHIDEYKAEEEQRRRNEQQRLQDKSADERQRRYFEHRQQIQDGLDAEQEEDRAFMGQFYPDLEGRLSQKEVARRNAAADERHREEREQQEQAKKDCGVTSSLGATTLGTSDLRL